MGGLRKTVVVVLAMIALQSGAASAAVAPCATRATGQMTVGLVRERGAGYAASLEAIAAIVVKGAHDPQAQVGWVAWDDRGGTWFEIAPGAPPLLRMWTGPSAAGSLFTPLDKRLDTLPPSLRLMACEPRRL